MKAVVALLVVISRAASEPIIFFAKDSGLATSGTSPKEIKFSKWVDNDDPSDVGDHELIKAEHHYHRCKNVPCLEPSAIKVDLADGFQNDNPHVTVKKVLDCQVITINPKIGLVCNNYEQRKNSPCIDKTGKCADLGIKCAKCADFKVAFLCPVTKNPPKDCYSKTPYKRNLLDVLAKLFGKEKVERAENEVYERHLYEESVKERKRMQKETKIKKLLELFGQEAKDKIDRGLNKETGEEKSTQQRALEDKLLRRLLENEKRENIKQGEAKHRLVEQKKREGN